MIHQYFTVHSLILNVHNVVSYFKLLLIYLLCVGFLCVCLVCKMVCQPFACVYLSSPPYVTVSFVWTWSYFTKTRCQ